MVDAMSLSSHREARPARFLSLHPSFLSPMSSGAGHLHLESVSLPLFPLSFAPLFPSLLARHIRSTRLSISFSLARSLSISIHTHTPIKDSSSLQTNLHEAYHLFRDADGYITPDRRASERWARASERDWREGGREGHRGMDESRWIGAVWINRDILFTQPPSEGRPSSYAHTPRAPAPNQSWGHVERRGGGGGIVCVGGGGRTREEGIGTA